MPTRYPTDIRRSARQEYFEYTPGVLRAFVRPAHLDSLTFTLQLGFQMLFEFGKLGFPWVLHASSMQAFRCTICPRPHPMSRFKALPFVTRQPRQPVFERKMGVKFIWGEVLRFWISGLRTYHDLSVAKKDIGSWATFLAIPAPIPASKSFPPLDGLIRNKI